MKQQGIIKKAAKLWRDVWMPAVLELGTSSRKPCIQLLLEKYETGIYLKYF